MFDNTGYYELVCLSILSIIICACAIPWVGKKYYVKRLHFAYADMLSYLYKDQLTELPKHYDLIFSAPALLFP